MVEEWACEVCKKKFRPQIKTPVEKLQEWWSVVKFRFSLRRFRFHDPE